MKSNQYQLPFIESEFIRAVKRETVSDLQNTQFKNNLPYGLHEINFDQQEISNQFILKEEPEKIWRKLKYQLILKVQLQEEAPYREQLDRNIRTFPSLEECSEFLKRTDEGQNIEVFIFPQIKNLEIVQKPEFQNKVSQITIFVKDKGEKKDKKGYKNSKTTISILTELKKHSLRFMKDRKEFPSFIKITSFQETKSASFIFCLFSMLLPKNREKAFADFIEFCEVSIKKNDGVISKRQLQDFKKEYSVKVRKARVCLNWYTKQRFFYKILNKSLRIFSNPLEIVYFRLPFSDIFISIKEIHKEQFQKNKFPKYFKCYRGCYFSKEEKQYLRNNTNGYIQLGGFISTSTRLSEAAAFMMNSIIQINVDLSKGINSLDFGFADIKKINEGKEDQVLFNVLNTYKIVKASEKTIKNQSIQEECFYLELQYGIPTNHPPKQLQKADSDDPKKNVENENLFVKYQNSRRQYVKVENQRQEMVKLPKNNDEKQTTPKGTETGHQPVRKESEVSELPSQKSSSFSFIDESKSSMQIINLIIFEFRFYDFLKTQGDALYRNRQLLSAQKYHLQRSFSIKSQIMEKFGINEESWLEQKPSSEVFDLLDKYAYCLKDLGNCQVDLWKFQQALNSFAKAEKILIHLHTKRSFHYIAISKRLGRAYFQMKAYKESWQRLEQCIKYKKKEKKDSEEQQFFYGKALIGAIQHDFGLILKKEGKFEGAQKRFDLCLEFQQCTIGKDDHNYAKCEEQKAQTYTLQGRNMQKAEEYFKRVEEKVIKTTGKQSYSYLVIEYNVAIFLLHINKQHEASEKLQKIIREDSESSEKITPVHACIYAALAYIYCLKDGNKKQKEILQLLEKAESIQNKICKFDKIKEIKQQIIARITKL